jgi:hypothetical protein
MNSDSQKLSRYSDDLWFGRSGFDSWQRKEIFILYTASIPFLGPTQPHIQSQIHQVTGVGKVVLSFVSGNSDRETDFPDEGV